jgi:outer membrane protein TolC
MAVSRTHQSALRAASVPVLFALLAVAGGVAGLSAQSPSPTSATNPYFGSVTAQPLTGDVLRLSLDDAVARGLKNNLGLKEAESQEKYVHGEKQEALQEFLPTVTLTGDTGVYQHNLAALGFGPGAVAKFATLFPGGKFPPGFSEITKDTLTQGQIHYKQTLFSGPVIAGWKAAGAAEKSYHFAKMTARGEVVQQVASAYLHAIAAQSEVEDARALVSADQTQFDHAHAQHEAGTASNLDELRAQVELQTQAQVLINAQNDLAKDLILLKRETGIDPAQEVALTDPAPYSELAAQTPDELRASAYRNRQDWQNLQNQVIEIRALRNVYRSARLPTLSFSGYWGVADVTGVGTHGTFTAQGTLSLPIFREASLRGDIQSAQAQLDQINAQIEDLRTHIDQQVRSALLDVDAAAQLVQVARSNVDLATRALSDETDRINAGVDDNLPLVTAQATLASAQSNLVESLYQYNLSKLSLARAAGVIETQYREYLGK